MLPVSSHDLDRAGNFRRSPSRKQILSIDKLNRGRCILGCLKSLIRRNYGARAEHYAKDTLHNVNAPGQWSATITRRCSSAEAVQPDLAREFWDFAHVHVGTKLVFAMRFNDEDAELIKFEPGHWERWFGTYDLADVTPFPLEDN